MTSTSVTSEAGTPTTSDSAQSDVMASTPRRHGSSRRRRSAGMSDMAEDKPQFTIGADDEPQVTLPYIHRLTQRKIKLK